jgi:hypothetical integral membrane protein (TIGR02206 family)
VSGDPTHGLRLFGPGHLAILASILLLAAVLGKSCRRSRKTANWIRYSLASFLALNEIIWYIYRIRSEGFRFPEGLPLNLCDVMLWVTVAAVFSLNWRVFELSYFIGIGGSGMALITPDLWAPVLSYPTIYFFLAHGVGVAAILTMAWGKLAAPRPGCLWRVMGSLNAYAAAVGIFNAVYGTNYMYLCQKPEAPSLLDLLGPWPVYVAGGEVVALLLFWLLWLPFRGSRDLRPQTL